MFQIFLIRSPLTDNISSWSTTTARRSWYIRNIRRALTRDSFGLWGWKEQFDYCSPTDWILDQRQQKSFWNNYEFRRCSFPFIWIARCVERIDEQKKGWKQDVECSRDERNLIIQPCFKNKGIYSDKLIIFNGYRMKGIQVFFFLDEHSSYDIIKSRSWPTLTGYVWLREWSSCVTIVSKVHS